MSTRIFKRGAAFGALTREEIEDFLGTSTLVAGSNITITYNDTAGTITISSTGGGSSPEDIRDVIGAALVEGWAIDIVVDDPADTITIAVDQAELDDRFLRRSHGGRAMVRTLSSATGAVTVDLADGLVHDLTLTGAVTLSLTGAVSGSLCWVDVILRQDTVGSRAVTWPSGILWPSGIPPTLSGAASSIDVVHLRTTDGGSTWLGWQTGMRMTT